MNGTGGGWTGTSGLRRRALACVAAVAIVIGAVNALTTIDDAQRAGLRLDAWEPWVWEFSSIAFWIAVLPLLWWLASVVRPPRIAWAAAIAIDFALTVPVSALHLAWLALVRPPVYAALGAHYLFDWSRMQVIYEFRKDVPVMLMLIGLGIVFDQWATRRAAAALPPAAPPPAVPPPYRLEVRDGARVRWVAPGEIEYIEAAGNYVELSTAAGPLLYRATLAGVEAALAGHGFVRIHRSRLVRADAITALATTPSGDFDATLASGAVVGGSRRFRAGLG